MLLYRESEVIIIEPEEYYNDKERHENSLVFVILKIVLFLFFSPVIVIGSLFYFVMFKLLKQKPTFSLLIAFIIALIGIIPTLLFKKNILSNIITIYFVSCSWLGLLFGQLFIFFRALQLKQSPELKILKGWAYKFEYKNSIFDKLKRKKIIKQCNQGQLFSLEAAPLGILDDEVKLPNDKVYKKIEPVYSYYDEAFKTRFISGVTGGGKTITMLNLMYNDIMSCYPICAIDFKAGIELAYFLSKWAFENNRPFYHFQNGRVGSYKNPYCKYQATYDPIASGDYSSKADLILNLREWDSASEVYKNRTKTILQALFYLLDTVDKNEVTCIPWQKGGIAQLLSALNPVNLFEMLTWFKNKINSIQNVNPNVLNRLKELEGFYNDLTSSTRSPLREQVDSLTSLLRTLVFSSYSDWLSSDTVGYHINLFDIATSDKAPIVLFQFSPNSEPDFAKYMGSIVMYDLARVSKEKGNMGNKTPFGLYIDEFQTLNPDMVAGIAEKARAARFFTTLSVQTADQIAKTATKNAEETLTSLFGTINTFIIHAGSFEDTALKFSKIIGKSKQTKYSATGKRSSGFLSFNWKNERNSVVKTEEVFDYIIDPSEFQKLSMPSKANNYKTTAYYITKSCSDENFAEYSQPIARKVHLIPYYKVLEDVPEEFKQVWNNREISDEDYYKNQNETQKIQEQISKQNDIINDNNFTITEEIVSSEVSIKPMPIIKEPPLNLAGFNQGFNQNKKEDKNNINDDIKVTSFDILTKKKG